MRLLSQFMILEFQHRLGLRKNGKKIVGPVSIIVKLITQRDGDLSTFFDDIDENENGINKIS